VSGVSTETLVQPALTAGESTAGFLSDRRSDVDVKTARVAELLRRVRCDSLLLLEPENFAWITAGGTPRGVIDPGTGAAVYCTPEARWVVAGGADAQRLFDEEIDGLGFQLKEWPWHWGREQLLAELCGAKKVACDRPLPDAVLVEEQLRHSRRRMTLYDQACYRAMGMTLAHALEATCRAIAPGDTEREVAGHLAHRLIHRGVHPVHIGVAADGRSRLYRRFGYTPAEVRRYAVLTATGRKYGVHATASRSVCFGALPDEFRREHNAGCRVGASYLASTWPDAVPREILLAGRRIYLISGFEHEWMQAPQGHLTGRAPVELALTPSTEELFEPGWVVTWSANAGAALACDTFLITDDGARDLTPADGWPQKRIRVQGADMHCPDVLQR
jgi:Xaa-Pro aminopeptidase